MRKLILLIVSVIIALFFLAACNLLGVAGELEWAQEMAPVMGSERAQVMALASGLIVNGIQWADTSGNGIQAHGGGFIKVGSYYYWFGENRNSDYSFKAVTCYRSADLKSWEYRSNALSSSSDPELNGANVERPKVIYNSTTGKYVMWMHWENGDDYGEARCAVAYSSSVEGPYTYLGSFRPYAGQGIIDHGKDGYMSRDCNLFVDTDGSAYFISSSNENMDLHLYKLTADYLDIDYLVKKLFVGSQREAPVIFKRNGYYFLLTSGCTGWAPNQAKYSCSSTIGGWTNLTNVADSTTYYSQPTYVIAVQGTSTSYLYCGDRWAGAWSGPYLDSMYVWEPIGFPSNTTMSMTWYNSVTIDAAAGTVTGSNKNFKFINKNSGKLAEVKNASTANGAAIIQYTSNGGNNQKWTLNYDGAGYFKLTNVNSGKLIDVPNASTADYVALIQYTSNGGANQKWRLIDLGSGYFLVKNKNSSKYMEVYQSSTANAAVVDQCSLTGANNQIWQMEAW